MAFSAASTMSLSRKLDGSPPVLPPISTLTDRSKLEPMCFGSVADVLEGNGYSVGWDDGSLQVGGSLALGSLPLDAAAKSGYRPRTSGILTFSKSRDSHSRPRTSLSLSLTAPPTPSAAPPTPPTPSGAASSGGGGRRERFARISSSPDAASPRPRPLANGPPTAAAANGGRSLSDSSAQPPPPPPPAPSSSSPSRRQAHYLTVTHPRTPTPDAHSGARSGGGVATPPALALPSSSRVASTMGLTVPPANLRDAERPGTGMPAAAAAAAAGTQTGGSGIVQVPLGLPSPRSSQAQASMFRASRGQALMVFNELDTDKNGKVTHSELEAAALSLGFSLDQAQRLWDRLDTRHRGFLEPLDWGNRQLFSQIQLFSTRYLQKYMGVPDVSSTPEQVRKFLRNQELRQVKSLGAAINMVRANAISRGMQAAGSSGNPIYDTFRFMDADSSGTLSKEEIRDSFFALGVHLSPEVIEQIMKIFDKDGNGRVQYYEFEKTMFPPGRGS